MRLSGSGKKQLLLLLVFSLVATQAAVAVNFLDTIYNLPVLDGITIDNLTGFYDKFWWLVDLIAYSVVIGVVFKFAAQKQFEGGQGNTIAVVLAIVLGVGAVIFESRTDFRLANLGPLGIAVGLLMVGKWIWDFTNSLGLGKSAKVVSALMYLAFYGIILLPFRDELNRIPYLDLVPTIADIIALVAIVMAFIGGWELIRGFWKRGGGDDRTRKDVKVSEADAQQIANVEQYEKKLDAFEKNLGKKEIWDEQQFEKEVGNAVTLAKEAENAEAEAERIMQGVQTGTYGKDAAKKVESLRRKYKDSANRLFNRANAAAKFAKMQRQYFMADLRDILAAEKVDVMSDKRVADLKQILGNDMNRLIHNNNYQGRVKEDFEKIFRTLADFQRLENEKRSIFDPQMKQTITALIRETDKEITDLTNLLTRMEALGSTGNLRKQQLYEISQNLAALLAMSKVTKQGIERAQEVRNKIRNVDNRMRELAEVYRRVLPQIQRLVTATPANRPAHQRLTQAFRI